MIFLSKLYQSLKYIYFYIVLVFKFKSLEKKIQEYFKDSKINSFSLITKKKFYKVSMINDKKVFLMPKYVDVYFCRLLKPEFIDSLYFELNIQEQDAFLLNEYFISLLKPIEPLDTLKITFTNNKLSYNFRLLGVIKETLFYKETNTMG